jgi:hypothetical protein
MDDIKDRAKKIRSANQANGKTNVAEALAQLFEDLTIYDISTSTPLASRLDNILTASADRFNNGMSHFSGIFAGWTDGSGPSRRGDTGFKPCFQDFPLWPGSSMQVSHFMTAVDMGFRPHKLLQFVNFYLGLFPDAPDIPGYPAGYPPPPDPDPWPSDNPSLPLRPSWWSADEEICVKFIIAHERVPDSGEYGQEGTLWNKICTFFAEVTQDDEDIFRNAYNGLGAAPFHDTDKAAADLGPLTIGTGKGNSRQDLLLSLFGFKFGTMIRKGELPQLAEGGLWVRSNLE